MNSPHSVRWKDLKRWNIRTIAPGWNWPTTDLHPLSKALTRRWEAAGHTPSESEDQFVSLRFSGDVEPRGSRDRPGKTTRLFRAHPGDLVYSKIDVRNGATAIVPPEIGSVVVTTEFPVYIVDASVARPRYLWLLLRSNQVRSFINTMVSGTSGRRRVEPTALEECIVPLPALDAQDRIVGIWAESHEAVRRATLDVSDVIGDFDQHLWGMYRKACPEDVLARQWFSVPWREMSGWDGKGARAAALRAAWPELVALGSVAEEANELVRPWKEPEKAWPVYGVNNSSGVFRSHYQKGSEFRTPYKRIKENWFFHNPTRANVGSLGKVPHVEEDAITSPEYQVWRITGSLPPDYIAALLKTSFFLRLVDIHRVGAVKERLYVDKLLEIRIPPIGEKCVSQIAERYEQALKTLLAARKASEAAFAKIETLIVGDQE